MTEINKKLILEYLSYDSITGIFTWKKSPKKSGIVIGDSLKSTRNGYPCVKLKNTQFYLHRLAFVFMGMDPKNFQVDHINGIITDNSWKNLRLVTPTKNAQNRKDQRENKAGITFEYNKFRARIRVNRKLIHLGLFSTENEARAARKSAQDKYFGH